MHKKTFSCQYSTAETGFKENLMKDVDLLIKLQVGAIYFLMIDQSHGDLKEGGDLASRKVGCTFFINLIFT